VAVQRDGRSHKLNVRLRAHWGCHDLTTLKLPEVLLQPDTTTSQATALTATLTRAMAGAFAVW